MAFALLVKGDDIVRRPSVPHVRSRDDAIAGVAFAAVALEVDFCLFLTDWSEVP
jgi:hypothetical protein